MYSTIGRARKANEQTVLLVISCIASEPSREMSPHRNSGGHIEQCRRANAFPRLQISRLIKAAGAFLTPAETRLMARFLSRQIVMKTNGCVLAHTLVLLSGRIKTPISNPPPPSQLRCDHGRYAKNGKHVASHSTQLLLNCISLGVLNELDRPELRPSFFDGVVVFGVQMYTAPFGIVFFVWYQSTSFLDCFA
jgi:hypothetical protein